LCMSKSDCGRGSCIGAGPRTDRTATPGADYSRMLRRITRAVRAFVASMEYNGKIAGETPALLIPCDRIGQGGEEQQEKADSSGQNRPSE